MTIAVVHELNLKEPSYPILICFTNKMFSFGFNMIIVRWNDPVLDFILWKPGYIVRIEALSSQTVGGMMALQSNALKRHHPTKFLTLFDKLLVTFVNHSISFAYET